jgi:histidinol-phosphatase
MTGADLLNALEVAKRAALAAGMVIKQHFGHTQVEYKADATPVTLADRAAERAIKNVLQESFAQHDYFGEEEGEERRGSDYLWLIDPIDGTKSFVRGSPLFSTQIALMHKNELILGVSFASEYGQMAWASKDGGAWLDGQPIRIAENVPLNLATLSSGNLKSLAKNPARWSAWAALIGAAHRTRGYGDFLHYHQLAAGQIDAVLESDVGILDIAALTVIVREAGGVITDLDGRAIDLQTQSILAAHATLYAQMLDAFNRS